MTYDVQRWEPGVYDSEPPMLRSDDGPYVLAADAEAHEKAAVQRVMSMKYNQVKGWAEYREALVYQQAIRACIAAVEERVMTRTDTMQDFIRAEPVIAAMRALLEGGE